MTSSESFSNDSANKAPRSINFNKKDATKFPNDQFLNEIPTQRGNFPDQATPNTKNPQEPLSFNAPALNQQNDLIAFHEIRDQTSLETLQAQLEKAHHLLAYQENLINHLTEKVATHETSLAQCEQNLERVQNERDSQRCELKAIQSVCDDLRSLLLRQQRRAHPHPLHSARPHTIEAQTRPPIHSQQAQPYVIQHLHRLNPKHQVASTPQDNAISLGYELPSHCNDSKTTTKSPPVQVWSAKALETHEENPLSLLRKLSTLLVTSSTQPRDAAQTASEHSFQISDYVEGHSQVELPHFAPLSS